MIRNTLAALALAAVAATGFAADKCPAVPKDQWQPQQALEKKLTEQGWKIKKVKIEDGCYEVYGTDAAGKRQESFFDPKTLEPAKQ